MTGVLPYGDYVYANWGRWVVHCSYPWCDNAMQVCPGQAKVTCTDCQTTVGPLIWPADPEGIEAILMMRPAPKTRNWLPGETLQDLLAENVAHGVLPPGLADEPLELMTTVDDRIVSGTVGLAIRSDTRRHQIEAATFGGQ